MNKVSRSFLGCFFLLTGISFNVYSQSVEPFAFTFPQLVSVGGAHAARATGVMALFENPAGFVDDAQELSVSVLSLNISGPVFSMADMAVSAFSSTAAEPLTQVLSGIPNLLDSSGRLFAAVDMTGPLAFSYVGKGLGFGLYNRSYMILNVASPFSASVGVREETVLMGGYAYRFALPNKQNLDVGIMPKGFLRAELTETTTLLTMVTVLSDPLTMSSGVPFSITAGAGFDLGLRWNYDDRISLGLVCRDAYSPASTRLYSSVDGFFADAQVSFVSKTPGLIPPDLSIGTFFKPSLDILSRLGTDVFFLMDYRDIFDLFAAVPRNPILNVALGMEVQIMKILQIQAGIKDALPVLGFSVDLSFMNISLAMYGRELGMDPGQRPVYNLLLGLDFVY